MKPKKILLWLLFALVAYNVWGYVKMHTRGDVIAYKRFAESIFDGDRTNADRFAVDGLASTVLNDQEKRMEVYRESDQLFTYYKIINRRLSEDGKIVSITAEQVTRVNRYGVTLSFFNKFLGEHAFRIRHRVRLVSENDYWKVYSFSDPATLSALVSE